MYKNQIDAFREHLMWTLSPIYKYDDNGKPIKVIGTDYKCVGCGFKATTEDERHAHIVEKIEDSHLKDTMTRQNWLDLQART